MRLKQKIKNFYKRWNIKYDETWKFSNFKNRALGTIDSILGNRFLQDEELQQRYLKLIGRHIPQSKFDPLDFTKVFQSFQIKEFKDSPIYQVLSQENDFVEFIKHLQSLFWLDLPPPIKEKLYKGFKEDIELSMLDIELKKVKSNDYLFYPKGARLLDEKVVNDVLDWLRKYPKVYDNFKSALEKYQNKVYQRNLIDDLRLALELLLKIILREKISKKEKLISVIGKYLKQKNVPTPLRQMFCQSLLPYYIEYQNEYAKHNDKVSYLELEFMIYLTGTFMRFLITLEEGAKNK